MNTAVRTLIAVATVAAAAVTGPSALARTTGAHAHHGHAAHTTGHHAHAAHGDAAQRDQAKTLRSLAHLDRRLAQAVRGSRLGRLTDTDQAAFQANSGTDRAAVAATSAALTADASDANLAAARSLLDTFRPQVYVVGLNIVRHVERLTARVADLQAAVAPDSSDATDLTTASTMLAGVQSAGFTASTPGAVVHAAQHTVAQAQALVGQVADDVSGTSGTTAD